MTRYLSGNYLRADNILDTVRAPPEVRREIAPHTTIQTVAEQQSAREMQSAQAPSSQLANTSTTATPEDASIAPGTPDGLEEEASQQGAFNEETGEINWDCPCLGGMAHGPCGEQFRAAFSCFVFSKEEPKGVDCIEHFKTMQNCFREHPDVYGAELEDDEEQADALEGQPTPVTGSAAAASEAPSEAKVARTELPLRPENDSHSIPGSGSEPSRAENLDRVQELTASAKQQHGVGYQDEEAVPKPWHDSR